MSGEPARGHTMGTAEFPPSWGDHTSTPKLRVLILRVQSMSLEWVFGSQYTRLPCSYRYVCAANWMGLRHPVARGPPALKCGDREFCHSAHTRPSRRGEYHFFGGENTRPKTGRRAQQKTNRAGKKKANRKATRWVSAGKTQPRNTKNRGTRV